MCVSVGIVIPYVCLLRCLPIAFWLACPRMLLAYLVETARICIYGIKMIWEFCGLIIITLLMFLNESLALRNLLMAVYKSSHTAHNRRFLNSFCIGNHHNNVSPNAHLTNEQPARIVS